MKLKIIVPIISKIFNESIAKEISNYNCQGIEFDIENLDYGTESIECEYDEALVIPDILNKAKKAEEEGFDGVVVDCFGDPGVRAAREVLNIPVVGGFEPSMLLGAGLGDRLGIVTVLPTVLPMLEGAAKRIGLDSRVVCFRYVDIPVLDLGSISKLEDALYAQSIEAIEKDNAHVIILGCTGMMGMGKKLHNRLIEGSYDVPVIDPFFAAIKLIEVYIAMDLKHSRRTYMKPRDKTRKWW